MEQWRIALTPIRRRKDLPETEIEKTGHAMSFRVPGLDELSEAGNSVNQDQPSAMIAGTVSTAA